jgi:hypothetical protein
LLCRSKQHRPQSTYLRVEPGGPQPPVLNREFRNRNDCHRRVPQKEAEYKNIASGNTLNSHSENKN